MMQTIQREQVKPMDNEPNEFISAALRNSVVLRTLMQHFSSTELLKLSLVSKVWNYEAKSLVRDRGTCSNFKTGRSTCEELKEFAYYVRHMAVVPFTGMHIQACKVYEAASHRCYKELFFGPSLTLDPRIDLDGFSSPEFSRYLSEFGREIQPAGTLDPSFDVILDRLPLKRLSLHIHKDSAHKTNCQAILLAKNMLRHFSEVIEELSINAQLPQFIEDYNVPDLSFRRLKTLKITGSPRDRYGWEKEFVKGLVSRAPNLEQLQTCGSLHIMDEILRGSSAIGLPSGGLDPFETELPDSRFKRLRIEKLVVLTTSQNFSVERFNSRIPALLQTYHATLNTLHIDVKCIGPLMSYGLCFPNVTEFKILMNYSRMPPCPANLRLFKAFDFTRTLPALTKVVINENWLGNPHDQIQNFIEQGNAVLREPVLDGAVNIKHLCVNDFFSDDTAPFLSETFPSIEILSMEDKKYSMFFCDDVWNHWPHLKTIEAKIRGKDYAERHLHVDSSLCGIFPEEVAELREKDEEFLKAVNIVPVMPSIACFSELRTLKLTYRRLLPGDLGVNDQLLCSKVTSLLVFARCPNLSVTILNDWPSDEMMRVFDHMKPYASVVLHRETKPRCECQLEELGDP